MRRIEEFEILHLSFPRRRESMRCFMWHCVMGSRLRGNDRMGVEPYESQLNKKGVAKNE